MYVHSSIAAARTRFENFACCRVLGAAKKHPTKSHKLVIINEVRRGLGRE
ncbi:hypothetical protein BofuT4_uP155810.1 [Botrytis cinerea T4]|uniref:Uncharacterized protein n=1 Tax=Botryotinia fuckeliana (strain T4) TaxID=999810 RepID=G2YVE2_BOTF4|nr:hypothetical protein BofuT4_uP155810.1 [Botrytis cinerea T4]